MVSRENVENVVEAPKSEQTEVTLSDDEGTQGKEFKAATLELDGAGPEGEGVAVDVEVGFRPPGLVRDRPFSASMVSRKSTVSTKSRTSLSPHIVTTDFSTSSLFAYRVSLALRSGNRSLGGCF